MWVFLVVPVLVAALIAGVRVVWVRRVRANSGHRLVAIVGQAGHGKDTIGDMVMRLSRFRFEREAFAKPVKDAAKIIWRFSDEQLYDGEAKKRIDQRWGITPRRAVQFLGTEIGRKMFSRLTVHLGDRFWVEHFRQRREQQVAKHRDSPALHTSNIILTDARMPNETEFVRKAGGITIKVIRPGFDGFATTSATAANANADEADSAESVESAEWQREQKMAKEAAAHESEMYIAKLPADVTIVNDGSLKDLENKVKSLVLPLVDASPPNPAQPPTKKPRRTPKAE